VGCTADSRRPAARAMVATTRPGSRIGASATKRAPSWNDAAAAAALAIASRVLPTPPGPVSTSSREARERSAAVTSAISCSRPNRVSMVAGKAPCRVWRARGTAVTRGNGAVSDGANEDLLMASPGHNDRDEYGKYG